MLNYLDSTYKELLDFQVVVLNSSQAKRAYVKSTQANSISKLFKRD